jgi:outer membrane PBP1 activator LpoA protein
MSLKSGAVLAACVLAALLAGCAAPPASGSGPASVSRAERLLQQNNPAAAAQMFEQLAQGNAPPDRNDFVLAAARAWLAANRADDAQRVIDAPGGAFTPAQLFERDLLRSEVAVARGQYAPAWQQVSKIAAPTQPVDAARLFLLQQQVALRAGQPVEAVRAGMERERVASSDSERTRARRDLLGDLRSAIDRGLRIDPAASSNTMVRGWLEIGQIAAEAGRSPLGAPAAIERWRGRFPGHPAATIAASEIISPGERAGAGNSAAVANASPIGLLLPLTGAYAAQAALTRDGFLAAIARMPENTRPAVRIYDTGAMPAGTAIENARADGAGFLVGPLGTREDVQAAATLRPGSLPMMLLNNLAGSGYVGTNLYQYALAPEDEARQIARQMAGSGQSSALVLAPAGDWGTRVAAAFTEELVRAGGHVVAQRDYDRNDPSARITAALGIDESTDRHAKIEGILRSLTGDIGFIPRPRPDIDAIFAAGYVSPGERLPNPLLLINPFLNRFAGDIPVYITQDGLDTDARNNGDNLLGVHVLVTPWMLDNGPAADLRVATESIWGARGLRESRYFAFGYDAATLALAVRSGSRAWPLDGLTGRLNLTPEGRVERSLNWARVSRDGKPQPTDPAVR